MFYQKLIVLIAITLLASCTPAPDKQLSEIPTVPAELVKPELQQLMDSAKLIGSILIFDPRQNTYYSNDFTRSKTGFLPASTFKIVNSIIGLETGVVESDSTLFKWDGQKRRMKEWEQDLTLKEAFKVSCVPCYREIARKIGLTRMKEYLQKFNYGNMIVDSSSIDLFWLEGDSKISQFQQIDFLQQLYNSQLPISKRTETIIKQIMINEETPTYKLSGKTGWAIRQGNNIGWWVGYVETHGNVYFFATNVEPTPGLNMELFPGLRKQLTTDALKELGIIE